MTPDPTVTKLFLYHSTKSPTDILKGKVHLNFRSKFRLETKILIEECWCWLGKIPPRIYLEVLIQFYFYMYLFWVFYSRKVKQVCVGLICTSCTTVPQPGILFWRIKSNIVFFSLWNPSFLTWRNREKEVILGKQFRVGTRIEFFVISFLDASEIILTNIISETFFGKSNLFQTRAFVFAPVVFRINRFSSFVSKFCRLQ